MNDTQSVPDQEFRLEEATIDDLHEAIKAGRHDMRCGGAALHRPRARLQRRSEHAGHRGRRAGSGGGRHGARRARRCAFRRETVKASDVLPDLDKYKGPPLEYGRMEATASDPGVQQQFGMIVGVANGRPAQRARHPQYPRRALGDVPRRLRPPSLARPAAAGAPPVCEYFRHLPDALERAAELDALYGRNPDLDKMPMYGVVFSFKDPFDTKDMRSTGGGDAAYDIDFPARDHVLVEQLRNKGAIIFAKAVNTEYNGRAGDPGRPPHAR